MSRSNKRMKKAFESFKTEAEETFKDKERMQALLGSVKDKLGNLKDLDYKFSMFKGKVYTLIRMIRYVIKGQYKDLPIKSIVLVVMGLLYFLSPIDFIPDFITGFGLVDDISIILWIYNSLREDIEDFEVWESERAIVIDPKIEKG